MNINLLFFWVLIHFGVGYGIKLTLLTFSSSTYDTIPELIVNDFMEYSKENNLDINLERISLSPLNSTKNTEDYAVFIDSVLKKKSKDYDIILIDNVYTFQFTNHVEDLHNYLSEELVNKYRNGITKSIGFYKGNLVAMPLNINVGVLFSNKNLLNKYDKKPPKTWDEMIETAIYIKKMEKENENNDIISFSPEFSDQEMSIVVATEFLYSFRDNIDSDFPEFTSDNSVRALKKLRELKDKIASSDEEFKIVNSDMLSTELSSKILFFRFFYISLEFIFDITPLPGEKEGISASCIGGQSLIMNKYISEEKKIAAGKIIEFLGSKEYQKKKSNESWLWI